MKKAPQSNAHLPELQLVRAMAILCVLSVHASASATVTMTASRYYPLYNFVNIFFKVGTPTFILLSSFVLFYSYFPRPLDRRLVAGFYKKRLLYIVIPYVVFSAIYFLMVCQISHEPVLSGDSLHRFLIQLLTGKAFAHLYFVILNIQFYLLFPVLLAITKKWRAAVLGLVPAGFLVQWGFVLWNKYVWAVPNKGSWSFSYFSMFMLGAALGIHFPKIKPWLELRLRDGGGLRIAASALLWAAWLVLSIAHVKLYYGARLYGTRYDSLWYEGLWNFQSLTAALVMLQAAWLISRFRSSYLQKPVGLLGRYSFGIYLIHLLFLTLYDHFMPESGTARLVHLRYLGSWLFMLGASWAAAALAFKFFPKAWILFGKPPGGVAASRRTASEAPALSDAARM
jgi:peptidoglycan/LPS O-acetylase OafA/YrhL